MRYPAYSVFLFLYKLLIYLASFFHDKARRWMEGRKNLFRTLEQSMENRNEDLIWFHCASLGEFEQARPLIDRFKQEYPSVKLLVSFFSPSGYEVRYNYEHADYVFYLPLDSPANARKWMDIVRPSMAFFVKYEFWYYYLKELQNRQVPVYLIDGVFHEKHFKKPVFGTLLREMLQVFDHVFLQDQASFRLLEKMNYPALSAPGDTRFDRVRQTVDKAQILPFLETFKSGGNPLLVIGSSWPKDMKVLYPFINKAPENLKILIAPHEVHESAIQELIAGLQVSCMRYSALDESSLLDTKVLIVDRIGLLSSIYRYADYAYIGGAFGKGLHNILEAVTFGVPVFFGPRYHNFPEAIDLVKKGGAFPVRETTDFAQHFLELYRDKERYETIREINTRYIANNTGATEIIFRHCKANVLGNVSTNIQE